MHIHILDKYYDKSKRGYIYGPDGDTLNVFLYEQDVAALIARLDYEEKGIYYLLTNRVINLIVQEDPYVLGHGLHKLIETNWKYFFHHVGKEICEPIDLKKMEEGIKTKMKFPNERAFKNKEMLLEKIQSLQ